MLKRGYDTGERIIEVIEGNIDLVLYNNRGTSFYFYRFPPEQVFNEPIPIIEKHQSIVSQKDIREMLEGNGIWDYEGFVNELLHKAWELGLPERDEM